MSTVDGLAKDSRARGPRRRTAVLPTVVATASVRVVASDGPLVVRVPSPTDHIGGAWGVRSTMSYSDPRDMNSRLPN